MPKKTRKEKLLAEVRRQKQKLMTSPIAQESQEATAQLETMAAATFSLPAKQLQRTSYLESTILPQEHGIASDVYKTLLFSSLAFAFEAMVYWLIQRNVLVIPNFFS